MIEHPQVVHFPIALFTTAFFSELLSYFWKKTFFSQVTMFLLITGCFLSLVVVQTGEVSAEVYASVDSLQGLIRQHQNAGEWVFRIFTFALMIKVLAKYFKRENQFIRIFITLIMFIGIFQLYQASLFGGKLVYDRGVGVKPMQEQLLNPKE